MPFSVKPSPPVTEASIAIPLSLMFSVELSLKKTEAYGKVVVSIVFLSMYSAEVTQLPPWH